MVARTCFITRWPGVRCSNRLKGVAGEEDSNYWTRMMNVIRQDIQEYRSELDAFTMKRTQMERKLKEVNGL